MIGQQKPQGGFTYSPGNYKPQTNNVKEGDCADHETDFHAVRLGLLLYVSQDYPTVTADSQLPTTGLAEPSDKDPHFGCSPLPKDEANADLKPSPKCAKGLESSVAGCQSQVAALLGAEDVEDRSYRVMTDAMKKENHVEWSKTFEGSSSSLNPANTVTSQCSDSNSSGTPTSSDTPTKQTYEPSELCSAAPKSDAAEPLETAATDRNINVQAGYAEPNLNQNIPPVQPVIQPTAGNLPYSDNLARNAEPVFDSESRKCLSPTTSVKRQSTSRSSAVGSPSPVHYCNLCGKQYRHVASLRNHMRKHASGALASKRYKCPHCVYSSQYNRNVAKHMVATHQSPDAFIPVSGPYPTPPGPKDSDLGGLGSPNWINKTKSEHLNYASSDPLACKGTDLCFLQSQGPVENYARFGLLTFCFLVQYFLDPLTGPVVPNADSQGFPNSQQLVTSSKVAANVPYGCESRKLYCCDVASCGKTFKAGKYLENHINDCHRETRFKCPLEGCQYNGQRREQLKRHINEYHGGRRNSLQELLSQGRTETEKLRRLNQSSVRTPLSQDPPGFVTTNEFHDQIEDHPFKRQFMDYTTYTGSEVVRPQVFHTAAEQPLNSVDAMKTNRADIYSFPGSAFPSTADLSDCPLARVSDSEVIGRRPTTLSSAPGKPRRSQFTTEKPVTDILSDRCIVPPDEIEFKPRLYPSDAPHSGSELISRLTSTNRASEFVNMSTYQPSGDDRLKSILVCESDLQHHDRPSSGYPPELLASQSHSTECMQSTGSTVEQLLCAPDPPMVTNSAPLGQPLKNFEGDVSSVLQEHSQSDIYLSNTHTNVSSGSNHVNPYETESSSTGSDSQLQGQVTSETDAFFSDLQEILARDMPLLNSSTPKCATDWQNSDTTSNNTKESHQGPPDGGCAIRSPFISAGTKPVSSASLMSGDSGVESWSSSSSCSAGPNSTSVWGSQETPCQAKLPSPLSSTPQATPTSLTDANCTLMPHSYEDGCGQLNEDRSAVVSTAAESFSEPCHTTCVNLNGNTDSQGFVRCQVTPPSAAERMSFGKTFRNRTCELVFDQQANTAPMFVTEYSQALDFPTASHVNYRGSNLDELSAGSVRTLSTSCPRDPPAQMQLGNMNPQFMSKHQDVPVRRNQMSSCDRELMLRQKSQYTNTYADQGNESVASVISASSACSRPLRGQNCEYDRTVLGQPYGATKPNVYEMHEQNYSRNTQIIRNMSAELCPSAASGPGFSRTTVLQQKMPYQAPYTSVAGSTGYYAPRDTTPVISTGLTHPHFDSGMSVVFPDQPDQPELRGLVPSQQPELIHSGSSGCYQSNRSIHFYPQDEVVSDRMGNSMQQVAFHTRKVWPGNQKSTPYMTYQQQQPHYNPVMFETGQHLGMMNNYAVEQNPSHSFYARQQQQSVHVTDSPMYAQQRLQHQTASNFPLSQQCYAAGYHHSPQCTSNNGRSFPPQLQPVHLAQQRQNVGCAIPGSGMEQQVRYPPADGTTGSSQEAFRSSSTVPQDTGNAWNNPESNTNSYRSYGPQSQEIYRQVPSVASNPAVMNAQSGMPAGLSEMNRCDQLPPVDGRCQLYPSLTTTQLVRNAPGSMEVSDVNNVESNCPNVYETNKNMVVNRPAVTSTVPVPSAAPTGHSTEWMPDPAAMGGLEMSSTSYPVTNSPM
ncbi:unnamed protein product [Calicophoron daubneyi]|uniref:C2H2-type domain-containing protein n=1 Tax=Calicophoron daubneyi TaxID=300641 RepID=A0AAV2THR6_CALDB